MRTLTPYSINVCGQLIDLSEPRAMGIINLTPDSFYNGSRQQNEAAVRRRAEQIAAEGGAMIDVGACSTRPGADSVPAGEEMSRLRMGLKIVREAAPHLPVSVDTCRADVARMAVEEMGADIVNDVSGGAADPQMFATVARMGVPYVLTHSKGTPLTMMQCAHYDDIVKDVLLYFAERVQRLRDLGQKDIILDPGYGFAKTAEQSHELLAHQDALQILGLPILAGLSRKSMIYKPLGITPDDALNGTTVLNTIALMRGASLLRVHDVKEAVEAIKLTNNHLAKK